MPTVIIQGSKVPMPGAGSRTKKFLTVHAIECVSHLGLITCRFSQLDAIRRRWNMQPGDVIIYINRTWTLTRWVWIDPNNIPHLDLPARTDPCAEEDRVYVSLDLLSEHTEGLMKDPALKMNWRAARRAVNLMRQRRAVWNEDLRTLFDG